MYFYGENTSGFSVTVQRAVSFNSCGVKKVAEIDGSKFEKRNYYRELHVEANGYSKILNCKYTYLKKCALW